MKDELFLRDIISFAKYASLNSKINLIESGVQKPDLLQIPVKEIINPDCDFFYGYKKLKEKLCNYYNVEEEQIAIATGTSECNFLVQFAILSENDYALIEKPSYQPLYKILELLKINIVEIERLPEFGFKFKMDELDKIIRRNNIKLMVISNLHNPSMSLLSSENIIEIANLLNKKNAFLLVDEVFGEFHPDFKSVAGLKGNIIVTGSLTKVYGLGSLRVGWVIAKKEIIDKIKFLINMVDGVHPYITQACINFFFDKLKNLRNLWFEHFEKNRNIVKQWANKKPFIKGIYGDYGSVVWIELGRDENGQLISSIGLAKNLIKKHQIAIAPGEFFRSPGWIRLGLTVSQEELKTALSIISKEILNSG